MERGPYGEPIRPKREGKRGGWDTPGPGNDYTTDVNWTGTLLTIAGFAALLLLVWGGATLLFS